MTGGVVNIGYVELVGASLLMLVAGIVSWRMGLGQTRRIAVSTVRAFLQLLAMGLLLGYLFKYQTWWLVCLVLLGMCVAATQIATARTNKVVRGLWADVFLSITVSSMVIAFIVVEGIIHADPWYNAMQLVPISGMILGNTLAAAAVATDRLFASMDSRANEIYMMVALGATPRESAFPSIKAAVGAGMTPLLAQLSAAGICADSRHDVRPDSGGRRSHHRGEIPDCGAAHDFGGHDAFRCNYLLSRLQEALFCRGLLLVAGPARRCRQCGLAWRRDVAGETAPLASLRLPAGWHEARAVARRWRAARLCYFRPVLVLIVQNRASKSTAAK